MQRTISINLEPNQSLIDTLKVYSKLYKEYCDFGFKNKIRNKVELHNLLYKSIREQEPNILGIDRGINNILVCSNNQFFNSKKLKNTKGKYQYLRTQLQSKGTPSARRKLKIISGRERRFVSDINHILSKNLANSNYDAFVLEDLKKIKQNKGRRFNHKLGNWSFKQFETYLTYKTQELGKLIIKVNPKYTSQECSKCNNVSRTNRTGAKFKCKKCDYELNADLNASRNIAVRGTSLYGRLLFNQLNVTLNENTVFESSYKPINSLIGS